MKIKVLYFDGCPNHRAAVDRVKEVLKEESALAEIIEINVPDEAAAKAHGFLGSPTIRIDGADVEVAARSSEEFGMACRTYLDAGVRVGLPPRELILTAIRNAEAEACSFNDDIGLLPGEGTHVNLQLPFPFRESAQKVSFEILAVRTRLLVVKRAAESGGGQS